MHLSANHRRRAALLGLMLLWSASWARQAHAFAEDVCASAHGGWNNCVLQPCPSYGSGCSLLAMLTTFATQLPGRGRSTLHFDATYYLAQAIGFSPRDAYDIAAYDEAVDLGQFVLINQQGQALADPADCSGSSAPPACRFVTQTIFGVNRNNFVSGGMFFHFMAPPPGGRSEDGLNPALSDPVTEPFLDEVRRWAEGLGPLCVAGLTNRSANGDYATGSSCFQSATHTESTLVGRMPFVSLTGAATSVDWVSALGEQTVLTDPATGENQPASTLGQYLPADVVPLVRLGIYLHAVADRVSHHICIDASQSFGPRPADAPPVLLNPLPYDAYTLLLGFSQPQGGGQSPGALLGNFSVTADPDFVWQFATAQCGQPDHAKRHSYETGTDQSRLPAEDRTAESGLYKVYDAMQGFAVYYGLPGAGTLTPQWRASVVTALLDAIETPQAADRLQALTRLAQHAGWLPLPEYGGVTQAQWLAQAGTRYFTDAGTAPPAPSSGASSGNGGSNGGAADPLTLLALLGFAGVRRRRCKIPDQNV